METRPNGLSYQFALVTLEVINVINYTLDSVPGYD